MAMNILLTNDDSHNSPFLTFAIDRAHKLGTTTVVVPMEEQSFNGKNITCARPVYSGEMLLGETDATTIGGTPADCVNIGVYHVCKVRPDLILSGINAGLNAGTAFIFSSGTVGACLEANIAGIPAIALSQALTDECMSRWRETRTVDEAILIRLKAQTETIFDKLFPYLLSKTDFFNHPVTWNVNLPFVAKEGWELVECRVGRTVYHSCFTPTRDRYEFGISYKNVAADMAPDCDAGVLARGDVAITKLDMMEFGR